jgi:hypothetical protein
VRLARFDFTAFDEIRSDASATSGGILVVLVASIFAGLGSWLWALQTSVSIDETDVFVKSTVLGSLLQTAAWFFWVYAVHWLLTQVFKAHASFPELIRTMGFAFAPVALTVFIAVGGLAIPIGIFAFGATILLTSLAVQTTSDADPSQSMVAAFLGFGGFLVVMGVLSNVMEVEGLGGVAPGILFFSLDF